MRDSRSWTEILIFNHHLSGQLKSYYETPFIKFIVYYCCLSKTGQQLSHSHLWFPLFFPSSLRYNITHSSNLNFYLGITHFLKKIISNFILLERSLSLKLIFHYYNQFKSQIKWQRDRIYAAIYLQFLFFPFLLVAGLFLFFVYFFFLLIFWGLCVFSDRLRGNPVRNHIMTKCLVFGTKSYYVIFSCAVS